MNEPKLAALPSAVDELTAHAIKNAIRDAHVGGLRGAAQALIAAAQSMNQEADKLTAK